MMTSQILFYKKIIKTPEIQKGVEIVFCLFLLEILNSVILMHEAFTKSRTGKLS